MAGRGLWVSAHRRVDVAAVGVLRLASRGHRWPEVHLQAPGHREGGGPRETRPSSSSRGSYPFPWPTPFAFPSFPFPSPNPRAAQLAAEDQVRGGACALLGSPGESSGWGSPGTPSPSYSCPRPARRSQRQHPEEPSPGRARRLRAVPAQWAPLFLPWRGRAARGRRHNGPGPRCCALRQSAAPRAPPLRSGRPAA